MQITEDVKEYWDKRSEGFSSSVKEEADHLGESEAKRIIEETGVKRGSKILDIGCGPGFFTMILTKYGMEVTGIDYSDDMLLQAKANAESKGIAASFYKMDASDLSFEDESFDLIVSRNVIWNLERPEKAYSEILRVLRPGCKAYVSDGNYYLHLFDDEYKRARESRPVLKKKEETFGSHEKYRGDVDFSVMERLAENLPLSRELRPAWDIKVLQGLPCSKVDISFHHHSSTHDDQTLVMGFNIIITKESKHV